MSSFTNGIIVVDLPRMARVAYLTIDLSKGAGTFTAGTASLGDVWITNATLITTAQPTGLVSVAVQSNNAVGDVLLNTTLLANLLLQKNMNALAQNFILLQGKSIQYTISALGGTTGQAKLAISYVPLADGAVLA